MDISDISIISIANLFTEENEEVSPTTPISSKPSISSKASISSISSKASISSVSSKASVLSKISTSSNVSASSVSSEASLLSKTSVSSEASLLSKASVSSKVSTSSKASSSSLSSKASVSSITTKFSVSSKTSVTSKVSKVLKDTVSSKTSKFSKALKSSVSAVSLKSAFSSKKDPEQPRTLLQKIGLIIESIIYVVLVFLVIYVFANILLYSYERNELKFYEYGVKLDVNYNNMFVNIAGEQNEPTIVLIPDFGVASPIIYYKPLVDVLSDKYKVITMEPLGYGLSDMVEDERTIENIVSELHTGIVNLGIEEYYLMGHSVGGLYSLYWSNQYEKEVLGFIGIDTIVPKSEEIVKDMPKKFKNLAFMNHFGIERMLSILSNKYLFHPLYSSYKFNDEDTKMYRIITLQKGYNKTQKKEVEKILENLDMVKAMKFPQDVPVLNFICSENENLYSNWKKLHIEVGNESISNEVVEIIGDHTNSVFDQKVAISKKIKSWIKK